MIVHLVWFKLKTEVTPEQKQEMLQGLRELPQKIGCIEWLGCGEDFSGRSEGFHIGLAVTFRSRADLESYGPHAEHQAFVENFKPLWDEVRALDFEE